MKVSQYFWIINGFALLHAAASLACHAAGVDDALPLTLLTMTLTVIICVREQLSVEFTAINIILVNVLGFALGVVLARLFGLMLPAGPPVSALSTLLTTEIIGWGLVGFARLTLRSGDPPRREPLSPTQIRWIIGAVVTVLLIRMLVRALTVSGLFPREDTLAVVGQFLSNSVVLLLMVFSTILLIRWGDRLRKSLPTGWVIFLNICFLFLISVLAALTVGVGLPLSPHPLPERLRLLQLLLVGAILEAGIFSLTYMVSYAVSARRSMEAERDKANLAHSQYQNLKQQVNPHFLFNSLNILDCLVADGEDAAAREYIRKLAGLYRYMLRGENMALTRLEDEMEYVRMYADLLRVRFPEGLEIDIDIPAADLRRFVVTYSVQMLVENATKHNAISPEGEALRIRISSDGDRITVDNNLRPKLSQPESTGLGLKYIRQNYLDRSGRDITVTKTTDHYIVTLPLL